MNFSPEIFNDAVKRIKELYGFETDVEVAEFIGITRQKFSQWKTIGKLDIAHIKEVHPEMSIDWLLHGIGVSEIRDIRNITPINKAVQSISDNIYGLDGKTIKGLEPLVRLLGESEKQYNAIDGDELKNLFHRKRIPIYYGVSAGDPTETFNELKGYYNYEYLVNERTIGLEINIEDYNDAGIVKGELLIVDTVRIPANDNIVLARYNERFELYRCYIGSASTYYRDLKHLKEKIDITPDGSFIVAGVVIAKIKNM